MSEVITKEQIVASRDAHNIAYAGGFPNALDHLAVNFQFSLGEGETGDHFFSKNFRPNVTKAQIAELAPQLYSMAAQINAMIDPRMVGGVPTQPLTHNFLTDDGTVLKMDATRVVLSQAYNLISDSCPQKAPLKAAFEGPLGLGPMPEGPTISGGSPAMGDPSPPQLPGAHGGSKKKMGGRT